MSKMKDREIEMFEAWEERASKKALKAIKEDSQRDEKLDRLVYVASLVGFVIGFNLMFWLAS